MFEFKDVKYKNIVHIPGGMIEKGKVTTLVGESGGGKTTILKMLNKMISPTQGEILYEGRELSKIDSVVHRRQVTMLSQNPVVFDGSIRDNLVAGLNFQSRPMPDDIALKRVLEQVSLKKELEEASDRLSGGERQRLALGRILLLDSPVYLLDEPSSALDDHTEGLIIDMITDYVRRNSKTLVMVTHSRSVAQKYSDVIFKVSNGVCALEEL